MGRANKGGIGKTNKIKVGEANKNAVDRTNSKVNNKADIKAIASIDNSINSSNKITNQYASFVGLVFAILATFNDAGNLNFADLKKIYSNANISIFDRFITIFIIFTNTTFEKKLNIYKSNTFLFAIKY